MNPDIKQCLSCSKPLRGRTDKKFCDDYCRSKFNNKRLAMVSSHIKEINKALLRNWQIMKGLLQNVSSTETPRENLLIEGFEFRYFTHVKNSKKGIVFCCYDYGFIPLHEDKFLIVDPDAWKAYG